MAVRPAVADDVAAIRQIAERAYIRYVPRIGRRPAPMIADFQAHVARDLVTVDEREGAVAGFIVAYPRDEDYFVENVAVDPAQAGKGIGRTLMAHAEKAARMYGRDRIRLYTNMRMWENFPFYAGLGYHKTHEVVEAGFRRVYFEKELERT